VSGDNRTVRNALCASLLECADDPYFVFLTGDLGYSALESLQTKAGSRFINAGVAEQNMVSVAAGLAHAGLRPWVYSIAPFVYARPFEQIRNDVCLHDLPVRIIGNGGGYGYGVMGGTHHALEDYGVMLCLQNMQVYVPAFGADVSAMIHKAVSDQHPLYLRLGRCEKPKGFELPPYAPWRKLLTGDGPTVVVVGPLVGSLLEPLQALPEAQRPELWVVTELRFTEDALPQEFLRGLQRSQHLFVIEEHVAQGSAGYALASLLLTIGSAPGRFTHRYARGYVSGNYGSQAFHRKENHLDSVSIRAELQQIGCERLSEDRATGTY
jgi:transketolase